MSVLRALGLGLLLALAPLGAATADIAYEPEIVGVADDDLRGTIESASQLFALKDRPPANEAALRRRADDDIERLKRVVNGAGYWSATFDYDVDTSGETAKVTLRIDPGPLYTLTKVELRTAAGAPPPVLDKTDPKELGLEIGGAARSAPIIAAEGRIADEFARNGHPYGKVTDRKVVVDVATHTMEVVYTVDPGPSADFGSTSIEGLENLEKAYVERRIGWKPGTPFDSRTVDETRRTLVNSGLFSAVRITPAPQPDAEGRVPMTVSLTERLSRSVGVGLRYNTTEGFGARGLWEHRNLFGGGERLGLEADLAQQRLGAAAKYRQPDLWEDRNQDLLLSAELAQESPEAYTSNALRLYGGIERRFGPYLTGSLGLAFEQDSVDDHVSKRDFTLIGVPATLRRDTSDDLLNPTRGTRLTLLVTPWTSIAGQETQFVSGKVTGTAYQRLDDDGRYVLAGFAGIGSIVGSSRENIPADKRLYAGGGGSVRGYGYQRIGPLGPDDKPLGGKGSLELGTELRIKITESVGIVPFLEAGSVDESSVPKGKLFFGAGIGARYYTPIGPVRFDIGFPINPRPSDDAFQLYISLGQAF